MINRQKQSLVKKRTLTTEELTAIRQLAELCNQQEQLHMRLDWSLLAARSGAEVNDFLYYQEGVLVGYLMAYGLGTDERELTGMVHPQQRRHGIARLLLQAARDEYTGFGVRQLLLVTEHRSTSGKAFVEEVGAHYDFSEHEMVLTHFQERQQFDDRLISRPADMSDQDALATIYAAIEGTSVEAGKSRIRERQHEPRCQYYIATFGEEEVGCLEPVGMLRLDEMEHEIGIYSFGIIPDYQGRGYGRQMLEEVIRAIRAYSQKPIMLDVEVTNKHAFHLYRSCGFDIKTTYDYYSITLA
jgi:ribosomal protein S18 acetylase RimI-like enzyme